MSDDPENHSHDEEEEVPREEEEEEAENEEEGGDSDDDEDDDDDEDPLANLPSYLVPRVQKLKELHEKRKEVMDEYLKERAALEQKFAARVAPLYEERCRIVKGDVVDDDATTEEEGSAAPPVQGIPQFWLCAMMNHEDISERITEHDVDCLEKLLNVTCVDDDDGQGFTLYFHFAPNDYFENDVLTKTYKVPNLLLLSDEPMLKSVVGSGIVWKEGKALTYKIVKKKQRGKGKNAGQVRTVEKKEEEESFFQWFEPPPMPSMDSIDEAEAERLEEFFESDYEVAQAFRTQLIPSAVLWFTGEVSVARGRRVRLCAWLRVRKLTLFVSFKQAEADLFAAVMDEEEVAVAGLTSS